MGPAARPRTANPAEYIERRPATAASDTGGRTVTFTNQRTVIIGGSSGMGLATALIAATHLYLMKNRFVTGTVLTVDGGFVLTGS